MGYYTDFELTTKDTLTEEEKEQIIDRLQDLSGYQIKWGSQYDAVKWYSHEKDMLTLSKEFPDVHFILEGKGEEHDDIWIKHFKNGKKVTLKGEIKYPEFTGFEGE